MTAEAKASGNQRWQQQSGWLLTVALLGVIVFGYLMPATGYFTAVPGDIGDSRYNAYVLEHLYRVAIGGDAELWNPDFYYPFKGVLAFSDNHFGSAASYVLARLTGLSREHAFDVWFTTGVLFNFTSALYVLRRFGLTIAAAALGAFFYAFAVPVPAQDGHAQLVHRFAAPLAVLALWQMFERRRLVDLGRLAFFTVWQFYCSIYLGLFLVYLLAALTVALLIVRKPFELAQWRANLAAERLSIKLGAGALLLISALALAYLGSRYYLVSRAYNLEQWRPAEIITPLLPRLGSYLIADASPMLAWLGREVSVPMRWEHQMFIGFGAGILIVAGALAARRGRATVPGLTRVMLIALALLVAGTLWIDYLSLYYLVAWLPGIQAIRGVSRIILVMLVPMSVLVALGADAVWRRVESTRGAALVLAGLAALVAIEPLTVYKSSTPIASWQQRLEAAKALLPPSLPKEALLLVRSGATDIDEQIHVELDAMLLGQDLGYPVLNGYSAFVPPGYRLGPCVSAKDRLAGYSRFTGLDASGYARRLVLLDLDACPRQ